MVRIDKILQTQKFSTKMLLQVHDELLLEAPVGEIETVIPILKQTMEEVTQLSVPLEVGVGVGNNWDEAH